MSKNEMPQDPNIEFTKSKESLKVILTDAELLELSRTNSAAGRDIIAKEEELQAVKSQFKADIDKLKAARAGYDTLINNGWEFRTVDIRIVKDFRENTVKNVRMDTGEVYRTRPMEENEKQRKLIKEGESDGGSGPKGKSAS